MNELFNALGDDLVLFILDADCSHCHGKIDEVDSDKTASPPHQWLFIISRMPYGLCNSPVKYQKAIDVVILQIKLSLAVIHLDDIFIFYRNANDPESPVCPVLSLLYHSGVTLSLKMCSFFTEKIHFLARLIQSGNLDLAEHNTGASSDYSHHTKYLI